MCGHTGKKRCFCYFSLEKYDQLCVFRAFSRFRFPFQVTAIHHTTMQFSIFHTYREIAGLAQVILPFGAEFLFVFAPGAVFLPNHCTVWPMAV